MQFSIKHLPFLLLIIWVGPGFAQPDSEKATLSKKEWVIPGKELPAPAAASQNIRMILGSIPAPNLSQSKQFRIQEEEAWGSFITAADDGMNQVVDQLIQQFSVSIKKEEINGVKVQYVTPPAIAPEHKDHLFIHLHGGAYVIGGGKAGLWEAIILAARAQIRVISIDYRMPPQSPFPAAIDDVVKVYQELQEKHSVQQMALGGTSAGGGLALASIHKFKALGMALPAALFLGTPWSDLTKTGDTHFINEGIDHVLISYDSWLKDAALLYAGDQELKSPLISPIYGDLTSFPPTYLVTGTRDLLLSDAVRTHRKLKLAGVKAELNVYEGLSHADYMILFDTPESIQVYTELGKFLTEHLH